MACVSVPYTCIALAWLCGCDFISVWPFKRFLQGRGGREDNGSRHYLLLSCRLNVRPHTLWPSPTRMPSGCTCTHAPTQCVHVADTYWHARAVARGQNVCVQGQRSRSHTPTRSCVQADARWTFAFYIISMSFWGSCCRDLSSLIVVPAQSTSYLLYSTKNHTCAFVEETYKAMYKCRSTCIWPSFIVTAI